MNAPFEPPPRKGRLLIAVIMHSRRLDWEVPLSIYSAIYPLQMAGWDVQFANHVGDADLAGGRNFIFASAYVGGFDKLLKIDADVSVQPGMIERIVEWPVDVVAGIYPKRAEGEGYPVRVKPNVYDFVDPITRQPRPDGLLLVDDVPTGFLCLSRTCMEKMVQSHKDEWYSDHRIPGGVAWNVFEFAVRHNRRITEDFYFSEKWRMLGGDVWADPHITLHHHGDKTYTGGFAAYFSKLAAEERRAAEETVSILDIASATP